MTPERKITWAFLTLLSGVLLFGTFLHLVSSVPNQFSVELRHLSPAVGLQLVLDPTHGVHGTVVKLVTDSRGEPLIKSGATVEWGDLPLDPRLVSLPFFQVPKDAAPGPVQVRILVDGQSVETTLVFEVDQNPIFDAPKPRLDSLTVSEFSLTTGGANMALMVHGANFDVGSSVVVNDVEYPMARFVQLLPNPLIRSCDPSTLGYPITHFATLQVPLSGQTPGKPLAVHVVNGDGRRSDDATFDVPLTHAELDSDGDGLLDRWEIEGYDANNDGVIDVDLPFFHANPLRKDIFIEIDWMADEVNPKRRTHSQPDELIWNEIIQAFKEAPVLNPDLSEGITLHIDDGRLGGGGSRIPFKEFIGFAKDFPTGVDPPGMRQFVDVHQIKANPAFFDSNRREIFRYCVFAYRSVYDPESSGLSEAFWSNDFFVSVGWLPIRDENNRVTAPLLRRLFDSQTGTFLHELGHTFNLKHGGGDEIDNKPNYNSVMSYGWRNRPPGQILGVDRDCTCSLTQNSKKTFSYSSGMNHDLDEKNLLEAKGICCHTEQDWNNNGMIEQEPVIYPLQGNWSKLQVLHDYPDWAKIQLNFRASASSWGNN